MGRSVLVVLALALTLGLVVTASLGGAAYTGVKAFRSSCALDALRPAPLGQNSFVYAADGSLLGSILSERNREPRALEDISPWLSAATIAIEDRRFYEHDGLDYEGIVRAARRNLEEGKIVEGGSTITQQVVRNLYVGSERSWERKRKEACLALELDRAWSKQRILTTYLNRVFYGNRAWGAEAAAQTYFSKPASKLGPAQAALLAGLAQAPSTYDPFREPGRARERRNQVLRAMLVTGKLSPARYANVVERPLGLRRGRLYTRIREPYFFAYVRKLLVDRYGERGVRTGGLRVFTTIAPGFQKRARAAIGETLDRPGDPAAVIVAINPANGAIRTMTSIAPGAKGLQFNLAAQGRRQAGSAFKTFALAEAIRRGINPYSTRYLSAPFHYEPPGAEEPWDVTTYDGTFYGPSTIAQATLRSDNSVYARLTLDLGPRNVARRARLMGITTPLEPVASISLGSNAVSPLEMAAAYATLAAGGVYRPPIAIRKVVLPDGTVHGEGVWGPRGQRRALGQAQAFEMTRILERNVEAGTGTAAAIGRPAAGKTGTTDEHTDAWFVGYTPQLATAVWMGYPKRTRQMKDVHGIRVAGGTFPAEIWARFMQPVMSAAPHLAWIRPARPIEWKPFKGRYQHVGGRRGKQDERKPVSE